MNRTQRLAIFALALGAAAIPGCDRHSNKEVYYLVAANQQLPYWQTAAAGFNRAAAQYKITAKVVGPDTYDPKAELAALESAVAARPAGILVSVAAAAMLAPEINVALRAGIPVITMDSDAALSRRRPGQIAATLAKYEDLGFCRGLRANSLTSLLARSAS